MKLHPARPFTCLLIISMSFLFFVTLPTHYYLQVKRRGLDCSSFREMRYHSSISALLNNQEELKSISVEARGTPDESTIFLVPRHRRSPLVPYVKVVNRNKFEALFRDHGSSNPLPGGLTDDDKFDSHTNRKIHQSSWKEFYEDINRYQLYPFNSTLKMASLMTYLQESTTSLCTQMTNARQINLNITFADGGKAAMKPRRVSREYQTIPDHFFFVDVERHTAKIAAFHLDRILDFRRVPPTTGRLFNITSEISTCASGKSFVKSFFRSPANNTCFTTICDDYCKVSKTPVCGNLDLIEGSVEIFLPPLSQEGREMRSWVYPWRRSNTTEMNKWEVSSSICDGDPHDRLILDLIDLAIFDFLIGNVGRQHYHTFDKFGSFASLVHLNNGLGFGNYKTDEMSCLAPLKQCCIIRNSTYHRLLLLSKDEYKLGDVMRESMSIDPIAPVLYEPHYEALNRRLGIIIDVIERCLEKSSTVDIVLKSEPRMKEIEKRSNI